MRRTHLTICAFLTLAAAAPAGAQHSHHHSSSSSSDPALETELATVRTATERYRDHDMAVADGYVKFGGEGPLMGEHWYRRDLVGKPLDLSQPSTLQYANIGGERVLVGVAYTLYRRPSDPMPEGFTGDADHWHVHDTAKMRSMLLEDRPGLRWLAERSARRRGLERGGRTHLTMVHAWVWLDNPSGVFAQEHIALPYLRAGLPSSWAVDRAAAMGVALLDDSGCSAELKRLQIVAKPDREQRIALADACAEAERAVRAAMRTRDDLNAAASDAWRGFERTRDAVLTPEQRERLGAMVEHR